MHFTSGGTDGPRFDSAAGGLDPGLGDNIWGFLPSAQSARQVAEAFYAAGWRVRTSSWTEFEVENTYAELELRPGDPVHLRGLVVPERIEDLRSVLTALGLTYSIELSDGDGSELATYRSEGTDAAPS
jgi:hypothetical protein